MLTPIGAMREPVVVLTPVRTADGSGGEVVTYTPSDPIFVSIRATTTNESVQFKQVGADINHVLFGHWPDLNQIKATHRIRIIESSQEFDIDGGAINDPKRAWTRLNLKLRENG